MKDHTTPDKVEELDLMIPNMDTADEEQRAGAVLAALPGIAEVRMMQRGAFIHYRPSSISHEEIIHALRESGFRASTFQDSKSGKTGKSSQ